MNETKIIEFIQLLTDIKKSGNTIDSYLKEHKINRSFVFNTIKSIKENPVDTDNYNTIMTLYSSLITPVTNEIEDSEGKSEIRLIRDSNNKIQKYSYKIYIRDKAPLIGFFSREEMVTICRLYSYYGSNLTQREISREFPMLSLMDFKRLLRAFNITKASFPYPTHIIEENSEEALKEMITRNKENNVLRSYEAEKIRNLESTLNKVIKEKYNLQEHLDTLSNLNLNIKFENLVNKDHIIKSDSENTIIIWLSDMHVGCRVDDNALYENKYDKEEINKRLGKIVCEVSTMPSISNIIVCNLGDSLDGMDMKTSRRDHLLPQNMNNVEQLETYVSCMASFFNALQITGVNIKYYCVGDSNHDGCYGRAANRILQEVAKGLGIESKIFSKFIGNFTVNNRTYLLTHGKDSIDMKSGWPTTLDTKTEDKINNFIDTNNIEGNITVAKGDTHQSAITYGKRFKYKCVGAFVGSTKWSAINFGSTPAICDYTILDKTGKEIDGRIKLN